MKMTSPGPLGRLVAATLVVAIGCATASAAFVISEATDFFTPSFRGTDSSTYFGWSPGTLGEKVGSANVLNGVPSINPDNLAGGALLTATGSVYISGSFNIYTSVSAITNAGLKLTIPTDGVVGTDGFTSIIIQGTGFGGFGFPLDTFTFGSINGISATYLYGSNAADAGQWWAKWDLPGNQASYEVDILGYSADAGVLSVTSMVVDTHYSPSAAALYTATLGAIPEPSVALCGSLGLLLLFKRRR